MPGEVTKPSLAQRPTGLTRAAWPELAPCT